MDINKELKDLMTDFPFSFDAKKECEKIYREIYSIIDCISEQDQVLIRGAGEHTEELLRIFNDCGKKNNIVAIIDDRLSGTIIEGITVNPVTFQEKVFFNIVLLSSFSYEKEMKCEYVNDNVEIIAIYEELEKRGIKLLAPFYKYTEYGYMLPLTYFYNYRKDNDKASLESLIGALLNIKDFLNAEKYINEYIKRSFDGLDVLKRFLSAWKDLDIKIKKELSLKKDILWYWTDAVDFENVKLLPQIYQYKDKGIFFNNAYSVAAYTTEATRAIFDGFYPIDDYKAYDNPVNGKNSRLLQVLKSNNYDFIYVGYDDSQKIAEEYTKSIDGVTNFTTKPDTASTLLLWLVLRESLLRKRSGCYLCHILPESHDGNCFDDTIEYCYQKRLGYCEQTVNAFNYIDKQIYFYNAFWNDDNIRIFMSDHGSHILNPNTMNFVDSKVHSYLIITGEGIPAINEDRIFSYTKFAELFIYLFKGCSSNYNKIFSDYAKLQDYDYKSLSGVIAFINADNKEKGLAFRQVITKHDRYIVLGNGKELYYLNSDLDKNLFFDKKFYGRIEELRKICGNYFIDVWKNEDFVNSRKLYE